VAEPPAAPQPAPVEPPAPEEQAAPGPPAAATGPPLPLLVPREVSRAKLDRELADWSSNAELYRRRGWLLLGADDLDIDVAFTAQVAVGEMTLPVITTAIRLNFDNYDLWPPSLTFVDPMTGQPALPVVSAPERDQHGEPRNVLLGHPITKQPFLCLPGLREYHSHPQHSGDDWLLHRTNGQGRLAVICDRVWRRMARNVLGLQVNLLSLPGVGTQLQMGLAQGDVTGPTAVPQAAE
jgi:hypothetical protein